MQACAAAQACPHLDQFLHRLACPERKDQLELIRRLFTEDPLKLGFLLRARRALITLAATSLPGLHGLHALHLIFVSSAGNRVALNTQ
jgi:hypothetical protein